MAAPAAAPAKEPPVDKSQLRHPTKAHEKCSHKAPSFTMRGKTTFGNESRYRNTGGELGGDLSKVYDSVKTVNPKWSMRARASGIPEPENFPGPGDYPIPSTLLKTHPTIHSAGKGWTMPGRGTLKASISDPNLLYGKDTPSPQHYSTVTNRIGSELQGRSSSYTIRTKLKDPADREVRPGCQKYNPQKVNQHGPLTTPAWTMRARGELISKLVKAPGPGSHQVRTEMNGTIERQPTFKFGTNPRFSEAKKDPRMF